MFKFKVINQKPYLYDIKNDKLVESNYNLKYFHNDVLDDNYNLIESKYRNEILLGKFSTSQTQIYGKNKKGKTIYLVDSLIPNLPKFKMVYGGKKKGKIIITFKFLNWDDKVPRGEIVEILSSDINLSSLLIYKNLIKPKKINLKLKPNINEKKIDRKKLNLPFVSIDPKGCCDIDDAIYFEQNDLTNIYIAIAQPIYWLNQDDIKEKLKTQFSTLYGDDNINLWGDKLTKLASLNPGEIKPAYIIQFTFDNYSLKKINSYPGFIQNSYQYDYENCLNDTIIKNLINYTKNLSNKKCDTHELIEYWMIKVNNYIGNNFSIPLRVNKKKENKEIFEKFNHYPAYYSKEENYHSSLELFNYTHFTSPIRRIFDAIIHYEITYNEKINIDLQLINQLDKQTKKFHNEYQFYVNVLDKFTSSTISIEGYLYEIINKYKIRVYIPNLGLVKVYYEELDKNIGDEITINMGYQNDIIPKIHYWI